jgi:exodeoxyribonuclease V beta subunit
MPDQELRDDLARLAEASGGTIAVTDLPDRAGPVYGLSTAKGEIITCRTFDGRIDDEWRVASFSSLVSGRHGAEHPDRDETASRPPWAGDTGGPAEFPGGTRAGIFLHELFERLDFRKSDALTVDQLVTEGLKRWGYDAIWREPVSRMIRNTLSLDLGEGELSFTLADLEAGSWIKELEFFFPLRPLKTGALADCYRRWSGQAMPVDLGEVLGGLRIVPVKGMVRGFMDLVFRHGGKYYLADWKSNYLGNGPGEYHRERLATEMARRSYPLQYLLYTVALHRFLTLRDPGYDYESGFGGIRYLFLRGIEPARGAEYGLFSDLPPRQVIDDLTELLVEQVPDSGHPLPVAAGRYHAALY